MNPISKAKCLVIGCGSIGERHLRCLLKTGRAEPVACDVRPELLERMRAQYGVAAFSDYRQALAAGSWDAAVICTPAHTHIDVARSCLDHGLGLLIEKPLSTTLQGVDRLQQAVADSRRFVAVGYVLRFLPVLNAARDFLRTGALGQPLQVALTAGQHFPTFRPAYRDIYYARHETGGGAIQDALTHNVNAVEWLVGPVTRVFCEAAHQGLEGVTVEDTVCVTARHGSVLATYSLNQFQAPNEATYLVHCERGSLKLETHEQRWGAWLHGAAGWDYQPAPLRERDEMFLAQANAFLDGLAGAPTRLCTFEEARQTLRFNLAALDSWRRGEPVSLDETKAGSPG